MEPAKHFICDGYLHIAIGTKKLMVPKDKVQQTRDEIEQRITRLKSQVDILDCYLNGNTKSDPLALRITG